MPPGLQIAERALVADICSRANDNWRHFQGRAWAPMVLGPFAETKGSRRVGATPHILPPRRAGAKPREHSPLVVRGRNPASFTFPFCHPCEREDPETFLLANKEKTKTLDPRSGMTKGKSKDDR